MSKNANDASVDTDRAVRINSSDFVNAVVLAANTAEAFTVPSPYKFAVFSSTAPFYVNFNGIAAVIPTADITTGVSPVYNPNYRKVLPGQSLSFIASTAAIITIEYFV